MVIKMVLGQTGVGVKGNNMPQLPQVERRVSAGLVSEAVETPAFAIKKEADKIFDTLVQKDYEDKFQALEAKTQAEAEKTIKSSRIRKSI